LVCTVCNGKEVRLDLDVDSFKPTDYNGKTLQIPLPDVNGVPAGGYDIMNITFKPTGEVIGPVTVKILDENSNELFWVSA